MALVDGTAWTSRVVGAAEEDAIGCPASASVRSTAGVQAVRRVAMTASHVKRRAGAPVMVQFSARGRRCGRVHEPDSCTRYRPAHPLSTNTAPATRTRGYGRKRRKKARQHERTPRQNREHDQPPCHQLRPLPPSAPLKHQHRTQTRHTHQRLRAQTAEKGAARAM